MKLCWLILPISRQEDQDCLRQNASWIKVCRDGWVLVAWSDEELSWLILRREDQDCLRQAAS
jgi:hypothetical protein